jgi:hypothetical protein
LYRRYKQELQFLQAFEGRRGFAAMALHRLRATGIRPGRPGYPGPVNHRPSSQTQQRFFGQVHGLSSGAGRARKKDELKMHKKKDPGSVSCPGLFLLLLQVLFLTNFGAAGRN